MKDFNPKHLPTFKDWLTARGASVLANTNQYEVLRFQTASATSPYLTSAQSSTYYPLPTEDQTTSQTSS